MIRQRMLSRAGFFCRQHLCTESLGNRGPWLNNSIVLAQDVAAPKEEYFAPARRLIPSREPSLVMILLLETRSPRAVHVGSSAMFLFSMRSDVGCLINQQSAE